MEHKKSKQNEPVFKKEMTPWEREYRRYNLIYGIVWWCGVVIIAAVWWLVGWKVGLLTLAFGLWSWLWYENGATDNCIDEFEYAYPKDGFRRMFKSWPWFVVLAAVAYWLFL